MPIRPTNRWSRPAAPDLRQAGLGLRAFWVMGTEVTVLAAEAETHYATRAVRMLFEEWDRRLSRFRPDSELSRLNGAGGAWTEVSEILMAVLQQSLAAARGTGGIFDPTLLHPLLEAGYDRTFTELTQNPSPAATGAPTPAPTPPPQTGAWRAIQIDRNRVKLPPGAGLDFGGIAKGMAVDAAHALLRHRGLDGFAIDAGGDLRVQGRPPGVPVWTVAVETGAGDVAVSLAGGALATSSTLGRRWLRAGREQHHLIDPRSGHPGHSGVVSVTVAAPTCAQAEVAAKVALLLGSEAGPSYLRGLGLDGVLSRSDGELLPVGHWPEAA